MLLRLTHSSQATNHLNDVAYTVAQLGDDGDGHKLRGGTIPTRRRWTASRELLGPSGLQNAVCRRGRWGEAMGAEYPIYAACKPVSLASELVLR